MQFSGVVAFKVYADVIIISSIVCAVLVGVCAGLLGYTFIECARYCLMGGLFYFLTVTFLVCVILPYRIQKKHPSQE